MGNHYEVRSDSQTCKFSLFVSIMGEQSKGKYNRFTGYVKGNVDQETKYSTRVFYQQLLWM